MITLVLFCKNVTLFKYIHPNVITLSGILANIYIYKLLNSNNVNIYVLIFLYFIDG